MLRLRWPAARCRGWRLATLTILGAGALPVMASDPANGWCLKPDVNFDRQVDAGDLAPFVTAILTDPADAPTRCAADVNRDGVLDGLDIPRFLEVLASPDIDNDGVPDLYETDDGAVLGPTSTGTNPASADTDGDGLDDIEELFDTAGGLDLRLLGASPVRKDLFIEIDWFDESQDGFFHSHRPTAGAIAELASAFAFAPVVNPYGGPDGISMHVDYGQGGAFTGGNLIPGGDVVILFDSEFNVYKAAHFAPHRFGYFHYSIFAHHYTNTSNFSSGFAEINGDDFVVTLQTITYEPWIARTIMHELGHNLGLRHGGFQNFNFKPNYNSVMNYRYQFDGADLNCDGWGDGSTDYSHGTNIALNENNLDESAGVCGATPIDWDSSGTISAGVAQNINCYSGCGSACGVGDGCCEGTACSSSLLDWNDWGDITLSGLTQSDFAPPEIVFCQDVPGPRSHGRPSEDDQ